MDPGLWICYCVDHTRLLYEFRWAFVNGFSADFRGFSRKFFVRSDSSGAEAFAGIFHDDLSCGFWNVADDRACGWQRDAALGEGIFDAHDGCGDGGLDARALESEVAVYHFAVDEGEVFAVAEWLGADDPAVLEGEIFAVPGEVFAAEDGIFHGHIFRVPESVLAVDDAVFKEAVFDVLQRIFGAHLEIFRAHAVVFHEKIFALGGAVFEGYVVGEPAEFVGDDVAVFEADVPAFAKGFDAVELRIADADVLVVPEGGSTVFCERAIFQHEAVVVPEAVAQVEEAVLDAHVPTFLEGAFAVGRAVEGAVLDECIVNAVEFAFFIESLILDDGHHKTPP